MIAGIGQKTMVSPCMSTTSFQTNSLLDFWIIYSIVKWALNDLRLGF